MLLPLKDGEGLTTGVLGIPEQQLKILQDLNLGIETELTLCMGCWLPTFLLGPMLHAARETLAVPQADRPAYSLARLLMRKLPFSCKA